MTDIGKFNTLKVAREVDFGVYLDGEQLGEILLPAIYVPTDCKVGDEVEVFIYCDSDDELIATTKKPKGVVGDLALLRVRNINFVGAFLDWGLNKDLLVPFDEQLKRMVEGDCYVVYIYQEPGHIRLAASSKVEKFLNETSPEYAVAEEVDLLIYDES
ncbi:MAG: S1-like domain-containing RNA-binding protein, partial [Gammaproteobacteria bacterium]|nr:S1-like domain-containing RNA-binding protein [Gammaproteobacteria bacterium]